MKELELDEIRLDCIEEKNRLNAEIEKQKIRDYFAARAMEAFLTELTHRQEPFLFDQVAETAYDMARAMMKAREREAYK